MPVVARNEIWAPDLARDGIAVFPKALARKDIVKLKAAADECYELIASPQRSGGALAALAAEIAASTAQWGGIPIDHFKTLGHKRDRQIEARIDRLIRSLVQLIERATAGRAGFQSPLSYVRRHRDTSTYAPWHFDAYAAGSIEFDPVYNAWVPFVPVGVAAPSLEFLPGSHRATRAGEYDLTAQGYPTHEWMEQRKAEQICVTLDPGDVVVFDHYTLHRTRHAEFPRYVRTSAELRFSVRR